MRSFILFLLFIMLLPFPVVASVHDTDADEPDPVALFQGLLIFGANFTQVDGDTYAGYHKLGLNTGAMVYAHITQVFGASLELLYSQKGTRGGTAKESYTWGTYIDKYYLNLNYIEAALMLHADTYILDYEAGISYSRLLSSKEWAESDVPQVFDPNLAYFNSVDLNYIVGLSLRMGKRWHLNTRWQYSINSIRPPERALPRYSNGQGQYNELAVLRLEYTL